MPSDAANIAVTHDSPPTPSELLPRLISYALCIGIAAALLILVLIYGLRGDLTTALFSWPFLMKWTYALSMGLIAYLLCERVARPGDQLGWMALLPLLPLALLIFLSIRTQLSLPEQARIATWLGRSYSSCSLSIGLLSLPIFAALCRALRHIEPTQPRVMACATGLMAGASAAFVYGLYCTESSVSFVTTWYTLGMLLPAAVGALFGNTLLRRH